MNWFDIVFMTQLQAYNVVLCLSILPHGPSLHRAPVCSASACAVRSLHHYNYTEHKNLIRPPIVASARTRKNTENP